MLHYDMLTSELSSHLFEVLFDPSTCTLLNGCSFLDQKHRLADWLSVNMMRGQLNISEHSL